MAEQLTCQTALLLSAATRGERFLWCALLCSEHGYLQALVNKPSANPQKRAGKPLPQPFDVLQCLLKRPNPSKPWAASDIRITHQFTGLGTQYTALQGAAKLLQMLGKNAPAAQFSATWLPTALHALEAIEAGKCPETIYLKTLYKLSTTEGYPARQQWLNTLTPALQTEAQQRLFQPAPTHNPHAPDAGPSPTLITSFNTWLKAETDWHV